MYPDGNLTELAQRKSILQARIQVRRLECVIAAAEISRPLAFVDRMWGHWRRISPLVKAVGIPVGLLAFRKLVRKSGPGSPTSKGRLAALAGFLPMVIEIMQALRAKPARSGS